MERGVPEQPAFAARCLLRAARSGTLATLAADATPFASLVTPAFLPDGTALMLLSELAAHARHLRQNPSCALMVMGAPDGMNPQAAPRVTLTGQAAPEPDPALRRFWREHHPYAALYADFTDFVLWRLAPAVAHVVAGFARAGQLSAAELLPPGDTVRTLEAASAHIISHCNGDHEEALNLLAHSRGRTGNWRMLGVDCDGFDMISGDDVLRLAFEAPVENGASVRAALVRLVRAAQGE